MDTDSVDSVGPLSVVSAEGEEAGQEDRLAGEALADLAEAAEALAEAVPAQVGRTKCERKNS